MLRTRQHAHQRIVPQKIMMHQSGRGMEADQKVTDFRDPPVPRAQRLREVRVQIKGCQRQIEKNSIGSGLDFCLSRKATLKA